MISLHWKLNQSRGPTELHCPHIRLELFFQILTTNLGLMILFQPCNNVDVDHATDTVLYQKFDIKQSKLNFSRE